MKASKILILGDLALLALFACRTTETGIPEQAGFLPETAPVSGDLPAGESPRALSLAEAIYQSYEELSKDIPGSASIAVINIASAGPEEGEFAVEELIFFLVNSKKYAIVDRRSLDLIRAEQSLQLSGEVDDDTAVSIGHLTGAEIVITGSISPYEALKYLRLRALDVETGEIRAVSSRSYH
ncbi:MAG: CsgG/HfaB family protein [Treponema sp.]|jgi:curli biogenesis system outer membrane secretion channel CsgG|nr:CsgG/HfaB family protein [Treponema sp.]